MNGDKMKVIEKSMLALTLTFDGVSHPKIDETLGTFKDTAGGKVEVNCYAKKLGLLDLLELGVLGLP
jgi:hypothetical protein